MEWISVKDRFPEEFLIVQAKNKEEDLLRCCLINGKWEDDTIDYECEQRYPNITHWREYGMAS